MRYLDKLVLKSFAGPFTLTFLVVVFILLNRQLLFYYDDLIGKGLSWSVLAEFISYFAVFMLPQALPLAVLLSSLITFGGLAEHGELIAIKSSGISLLRVLRPMAMVVILLSCLAFYLNDQVVPKVALKAYALLYDIRQKKPTLDLREGVFYNGIPGVSIKVNHKFASDDAALKDVILYDHKNPDTGNELWIADSGRMHSIHGGRFLKFELYQGLRYQEGGNREIEVGKSGPAELMSRTEFDKTEFVFDLSSFDLTSTNPNLFGNNRMMRGRHMLKEGMDSINRLMETEQSKQKALITASATDIRSSNALEKTREVHQRLIASNEKTAGYRIERVAYEVQYHRILTNAIACFVMFLIGAPLGVIIRKGGLGMPVLLSIAFFLLYFVVDIQAEELAQAEVFSVGQCMWLANAVLFLFGVYFLMQARNDSRLFDSEALNMSFQKMARRIRFLFTSRFTNSF